MTTIGMNVSTWNKVMEYDASFSTIQQKDWSFRMEKAMEKGNFSERSIRIFADQCLISLKIYQFLQKYGTGWNFNYFFF